MHQVLAGQQIAVILDLGTEQAAETEQQAGLSRDFVQARDQQQAAGTSQRLG